MASSTKDLCSSVGSLIISTASRFLSRSQGRHVQPAKPRCSLARGRTPLVRGPGGGGSWGGGGAGGMELWAAVLGRCHKDIRRRETVRGRAIRKASRRVKVNGVARRRLPSERARRHRRGRAWTVRPVRHSRKFPNTHVAPLGAGRQCESLWPMEMG